jgi:chromate transporter
MQQPVKWGTFLKDVLICSLGAYGGPEAHYGVFTDQMVIKKQYLSEDELVELIALTGILPGPSSTQTIVSIGYKVGGPVLALLTMLVWGLPAILFMTGLSFMYQFLSENRIDASGLRFIGPMAVGFIVVASYRIGKKVVKGKLTLLLFLLAMGITYFFRNAWVFPLVLILGGITTTVASKQKDLWHHVKINPPYRYLIAFGVIAIGSVLLNMFLDNRILYIFQSFYRYGYLVIGGGQVVIPYMFNDLVEGYRYMTADQFLTGFGIVQGIPGPMFSFSAYAGGMASRDLGPVVQILSGLAAGVGIFLPGILLIFFVYPVWSKIRTIKGIRLALSGITAVAGGLIAIAAFILMQSSGFSLENIIVLILTVMLLLSKKVPAPLIVAVAILAGFLI